MTRRRLTPGPVSTPLLTPPTAATPDLSRADNGTHPQPLDTTTARSAAPHRTWPRIPRCCPLSAV